MRVARRAGSIAAHGTNFHERTVGLIQPVFALNNKGVGEGQMPVEEYLLVGREFEHEVDDELFAINVEHGKHKMLEIA